MRDPHLAIPDPWLDTLDAAIAHRGPDGTGRFRDRAVRADGTIVDVAFVHRRMSVIDLDGGRQPMTLDEGTPRALAVVFNGCIYNHRDLRRELSAAGHRFTTDHSDTEVLLHGWREWGDELWARLDGMFAVALWDHGAATLVLARDKAGEKPLLVAQVPAVDHTLMFASSARALHDALGTIGSPPAPTVDAATWLVQGYARNPPGGWPGVRSVNPGSAETKPSARPSASNRRYWTAPARATRPAASLDPARLDYLLAAAVRSRLEADVPLGCFLSGGVDSSLIAAIAKRSEPALQTFTVRMPDARYDESRFAQAVAQHLGLKHHTLECDPRPADDLVMLVNQLGLPLADSSLLPTYWVSKAAREHVKVALTGDGGDELFGGYDRYAAALMLRRHRRWLAAAPRWPFAATAARSKVARWNRLIEAARGGGYRDLNRIFPSQYWPQLFARAPGGPDAPDPDDPLRFDFDHYLPDDLLRKVDTASMAVALETRAPFLAPEVMEAALATPIDVLMPRGLMGPERKGLLKQVARRYLPAHIIDRPKQGFAIPLAEWFRTDFGGLKTLLIDHLHSAEPFGPPSLGIDLNLRFVRTLLDEHLAVKRDHAQRLYALLVLSIWSRGCVT